MDSSSIEYIRIEVASFERAIRDAIERINEYAESLEYIGTAGSEVAADGSWKEEPSALLLRTTKLRATTAHGLQVLQELAVQTGRLEVLAHLRTLADVDEVDDPDDEA